MSDVLLRSVRVDTFLVMYQGGEVIGVARTIRGKAEKMVAESGGRWRIVNEMEYGQAKRIMAERNKDVR